MKRSRSSRVPCAYSDARFGWLLTDFNFLFTVTLDHVNAQQTFTRSPNCSWNQLSLSTVFFLVRDRTFVRAFVYGGAAFHPTCPWTRTSAMIDFSHFIVGG